MKYLKSIKKYVLYSLNERNEILRPIYEYNGKFIRIGTIVFDEGDDPYIIVNAIDNEKYARLGVMEEIEAYPYDMTEERIEQVVKEYMETEL